MGSIDEIDFKAKVTRIERKSINRLMAFADSELERNCEKLDSDETDEKGMIDAEAFKYVYIDGPKIVFSLYALAIVHCYSILENNRKLICLRIPDFRSNKEKKQGLYINNAVTNFLSLHDIDHKEISCYEIMDEFRLVNNAIKHDRYNLSTSVTAKNQKNYGLKQLKGLYSNRAKHLETYLSDLYEKVSNKI